MSGMRGPRKGDGCLAFWPLVSPHWSIYFPLFILDSILERLFRKSKEKALLRAWSRRRARRMEKG